MSVSMECDQVHEASRRLRQAEEDLDAAEKSADILGRHYLACFLAHQAAEKALKAVFYARGASSVRGHSVAELCTAAGSFDPSLAAMPDDEMIRHRREELARHRVRVHMVGLVDGRLHVHDEVVRTLIDDSRGASSGRC